MTEGDFEVPLAVHVFHEEDFEVLRDDEVLVAVVIEVGEDGGGAVVHPVGFGFGRKVAHGAVGVLQEEFVWKSALLAEVEVFESIAIDVADGEAVVCGGVESEVSGKAESPMVGGAEKLVLVGGEFTKDGGGDVGEELGAFLFNFLVIENFEGAEFRRA